MREIKFRAWDNVLNKMYTGLKDKNKKEIYEGDIVVKIHDGKKMQKSEVKFEDGSFGINDYSADGKMMLWALRGRSHLFEIIGNIHENPELCNEHR